MSTIYVNNILPTTGDTTTVSGSFKVTGSLQLTGALSTSDTITVGVNGTGYDVKFFGDTAGQYMLWDQSADELVLAGDTKLSFHDAAGGENIIASADGHLEVNAGTTLDMTAPTIDINGTTEVQVDTATFDVNGTTAVTIDCTNTSNGISIGTSTSGVPVSIGHATSEVTVNDNLTITGDLTVNGATTTVSTTNTLIKDSLIELNNGAGSNSNDCGFVIERGSTGDNAIVAWDESADKFIVGTTTATGASTGNLTITAAPLQAAAFTAAAGTFSGILKTDDTTEATSTTDGSLQTDGGLSVAMSAVIGDDLDLLSDGAIMSFGASKEITLTHEADVGLILEGNGQSADPTLTIKNTNADATGGSLKFLKDGSSVADADVIGNITFVSEDDGSAAHTYASIIGSISDMTAGVEGGKLELKVAEHDGTVTTGLKLQDGNADGEIDVTIGAGAASLTTIAGDLDIPNGGFALGSDASGDMYYNNASGVLTRIAVGSDNHVLTLDGAVPGWEAASSTGDVSAGSTFTTAGVIMACDGDDKTIDEPGTTLTTNSQGLTVSGVTKVGASAGSGQDFFAYTAGTAAHVGIQWDADGNTEGTLIGGADDHGVDFKFFGETAGNYVQWDMSGDELVLAATSKLSFHDAAGGENIVASSNGHLEVNAGTTLDMTAPTVDVNASTAVTLDTPSVVIASATASKPRLELKNTTNDTNSAILRFVKDKGSAGAANDNVGIIEFYGDDASQDQVLFGRIRTRVAVHTNGEEGGKMQLAVASHDGELQPGLTIGDGDAEDEVDVTIGNGAACLVSSPGAISASAGLSGLGLTLAESTRIGLTGDVDLISLTTNYVGISGSLRPQGQIHVTNHSYEKGNNADATWIPWVGNLVENTVDGAGYYNQGVMPCGGKLKAVYFRPENAQNGNVTISLYKNVDGNLDMSDSSTYVEEVTVSHANSAATATRYNMSGTSHFAEGNTVGVFIDPQATPGKVNVTCVWELDWGNY